MHRCIASYLELCRRFEFSAPWDFCTADECVFVGPSDPKAAMDSLVKVHSKRILLASGIASLNAEGTWNLHPMLDAPNVVFVKLFDATTGALLNLMTERGCVLGDHAPMFEVLRDKHTATTLHAERVVYLTDTIADTALLRSFGMVAAPIGGFARLNREGIELLCKHYGFTQSRSERQKEAELDQENEADEQGAPAPPEANSSKPWLQGLKPNAPSDSSPPDSPYVPIGKRPAVTEEDDEFFRLTLVRWSPYVMSATEPLSMQRAIDELKALKRHRRLDIHEADQWIPTETDLESLRFALARRESSWIKDAVLDSVFVGVGSLGYEKNTVAAAAPPTDLPGAVAYLQEALLATGDDKSRQRRKTALNNYHRVVASRITAPMLRQAEAMTDPLDRALQLQFAHLSALFMERARTVRVQVLRGLTPGREETLNNGVNKSVSELLAISAQMVSLAKELTKWKPRSNATPRVSAAPKTDHSRRFSDSDLAMKN